jgi:hypothetical protein
MTFETAKDLLGRPDEWPNLSEDIASSGGHGDLRDRWSRAHARNPESDGTGRGLHAVAEGGN